MQAQIIESDKRFITVSAYQKRTGLSYPTVRHMIKTGQIRAIQTESGHYKVDTQSEENPDNAVIVEKLDKHEKMLSALCRQLNTTV